MNARDDDALARLLRLAGPRPKAPRARAERVRDTAHAEWRGIVRRRLRRRAIWLGGTALAAGIAGWLGFNLWRPAPSPPAPVVATLEAVAGGAPLAARDGGPEPLAPLKVGEPLRAGTWLQTGPGDRAALRLLTGASLRVDEGTRLRLLTATRLELAQGALYVDSGAAPLLAAQLEVETSLGVARDVGTQFEVRLEQSALRVRVREGKVLVGREGEEHEAPAGLELEVDAAGRLERRRVAQNGPQWDWTLAVAPPFELEGRRLADFLGWVTRETGWQVRFVDASLEYSTADIVLHGSLSGISPDLAPAAVLPTCGLGHHVEQGILYIASAR